MTTDDRGSDSDRAAVLDELTDRIDQLESKVERIDRLEAENERLREQVSDLGETPDVDSEGEPPDPGTSGTTVDSDGDSEEDDEGAVFRRGVLATLASLGVFGLAGRGSAGGSTSLATTLQYGGRYTGAPPSNYGLWLEPSGAKWAVIGKTRDPEGRGVLGQALATTGNTFGVLGRSKSPSGVGFEGNATAATGNTVGVRGQAASPDGYGLESTDDLRVADDVETDDTFRVFVDGDRTVRIGGEDNSGRAGNVFLGHSDNGGLSLGGTVGGGGVTDEENEVFAFFPTVGGGRNNRAVDDYATIGGGRDNTIEADTIGDAVHGTIAGGVGNTVDGKHATIGGGTGNEAGGVIGGGTNRDHTVAGGRNNRAVDEGTAIGGGRDNQADGAFATVPGGRDNRGQASYTFAAGRRAKARNAGSFVWSDSTNADFASTGTDQFLVDADGGVGINTDDPTTALDVDGAVTKDVGAKMTLSSRQSIPSDGPGDHKIEFDTVRFDDFGWADTNDHEFTVPGPAKLLVGATPTWHDINPTQDYRFFLLKDGSSFANQIRDNARHGRNPNEHMSMLTRVPAGTTKSFGVSATLFGLQDRELGDLRGENEFWVTKLG